MTAGEWAAAAEIVVRQRYLRRLWMLPGTVLGRIAWPASLSDKLHWHWNYWWQAHLLDCLIDAEIRAPELERRQLAEKLIKTIKVRNGFRWINNYYDDMAWLGLALARAEKVFGLNTRKPVETLVGELKSAWTTDGGGGIWWRRGDRFKNAPANGPAAILHARIGDLSRAEEMNSWMQTKLVDPETGLVWDGFRVDTGVWEKQIYTYCQGVFLGSCVELSKVDEALRTIRAIAKFCAPNKVIRGQNGGDGGLFAGILARYLALAVRNLPETSETMLARELVINSAEACWQHANHLGGHPVFNAEWPEETPSLPLTPHHPDRDLSVQLSAWMLFEAAASL